MKIDMSKLVCQSSNEDTDEEAHNRGLSVLEALKEGGQR